MKKIVLLVLPRAIWALQRTEPGRIPLSREWNCAPNTRFFLKDPAVI